MNIEKDLYKKHVADLATKVQEVETARYVDIIEKDVAGEANLRLITRKAELEKERANSDVTLERALAIYNRNLTQGAQLQDSCTR